MSGRYVAAVLVYLAFIALLPFPAATLGEYYNAVALSFFLGFMAAVSTLEVLLLWSPTGTGSSRCRSPPAIGGTRSWHHSRPWEPAVIAIPVVFVSVPIGAVVFVGARLRPGCRGQPLGPPRAPRPS